MIFVLLYREALVLYISLLPYVILILLFACFRFNFLVSMLKLEI